MTTATVDRTPTVVRRDRVLAEVPETRMGLGVGLVAVLTAVLHTVGAGPTAGLVVLGLVVVLAAAALPWALATLVAISAWAFLTGFLANALGVLTFGYADLVRAGVLLAAAAVAAAGRTTGARGRLRARSGPLPMGRADPAAHHGDVNNANHEGRAAP